MIELRNDGNSERKRRNDNAEHVDTKNNESGRTEKDWEA